MIIACLHYFGLAGNVENISKQDMAISLTALICKLNLTGGKSQKPLKWTYYDRKYLAGGTDESKGVR